jgi:hypothetical protein
MACDCACGAGGGCCGGVCMEGALPAEPAVSGVCDSGRRRALDDLIRLAKEKGDWTLPILMGYLK